MKVRDEIIKDDLLSCLFCENVSISVRTCHDLEDCENFESCDDIGCYSAVYGINDGGCGASSGYRATIKEAVDAWNRRIT